MGLTKKDIIRMRQIAQTIKPMFQIGKDGLTGPVLKQIDNYLFKHELGKLAILPSCPLKPAEVGIELAKTGIEMVQTIGKNLVIYKANPSLKPEERVI
ncbi:MAG: YhbY family RNA-binding protein [Candidatus Izemoplasmatales bacterium]|nr:YhbY family RNA-binding protein [Acholeplasmataceae bacterium]